MRQMFENDELAFSGTSAGLHIAVLGPMLTGGGTSYPALRYGVVESRNAVSGRTSYDVNGGSGFFKYCMVDSHFSYRGY